MLDDAAVPENARRWYAVRIERYIETRMRKCKGRTSAPSQRLSVNEDTHALNNRYRLRVHYLHKKEQGSTNDGYFIDLSSQLNR